MGEELNRHFIKEDIIMANKHMNIWPTLLVIKEGQSRVH